MNVSEFDRRNDTEKTELVLTAIFLAERLTHRHYVRLYSLERFYVEVYFEGCSGLITHFKAFDDMDRLDPYLRDLRIAV